MAQSDRRPRRGGRQEPPGQPEELAHPSEEPGGRAGRVLTEVGWVQDVIVNKASGFVVDGHARVALAIKAGEKVPVVYVELDEREEAVILATLDPVTMPEDLWLLGSHRLLCAEATAIDAVERLGVTPPLVKNCTLSTKEGLKVFQSCRRRKLYTAPSGRI